MRPLRATPVVVPLCYDWPDFSRTQLSVVATATDPLCRCVASAGERSTYETQTSKVAACVGTARFRAVPPLSNMPAHSASCGSRRHRASPDRSSPPEWPTEGGAPQPQPHGVWEADNSGVLGGPGRCLPGRLRGWARWAGAPGAVEESVAVLPRLPALLGEPRVLRLRPAAHPAQWPESEDADTYILLWCEDAPMASTSAS